MHINDDRIGRSLERIFDSDRSSLLTDIVVHAVREFDLSMKRFHNDSTSVALSGLYRTATGKDMRMKRTVNLTFGHRKDLKQLVWILTVTADGAVPVHYNVANGNTSDSPTHIETWDSIRKLTGRPDFMYVADSKLCTDENMKFIDEKHGRFITVLPATRKEHERFRSWLQDHPDPWEATVHGRKDEKGQVWKLMESLYGSSFSPVFFRCPYLGTVLDFTYFFTVFLSMLSSLAISDIFIPFSAIFLIICHLSSLNTLFPSSPL